MWTYVVVGLIGVAVSAVAALLVGLVARSCLPAGRSATETTTRRISKDASSLGMVQTNIQWQQWEEMRQSVFLIILTR